MKKYLLLIISSFCLVHAKHVIKVSNYSNENVYLDLRSQYAESKEEYRDYEFLYRNEVYTYSHSRQIKLSRIRIGNTVCKGETSYYSNENSILNLMIKGSEEACFITSWEQPNFEV